MPSEKLTFRNTISLAVVFVCITGAVLGLPAELAQDGWVSLLIAFALFLPFLFFYARIIRLLPEKDLCEIFEELFGCWIGRTLSVLTAFYAIFAGAVALRLVAMFFHLTSFDRTPLFAILLPLAFASAYLAKSDISVFGRWSGVISAVAVLSLVYLLLSALSTIDIKNFLPAFDRPAEELFSGGLRLLLFPFSELFLLLTFSGAFPKEKSPYRLFFLSALLSMLFLLMLFLRNLAVLGPESLDTVYFPTYRAASIVKSGSFFERLESLINFLYFFFGVTKVACCLIGASKCIASAFGTSRKSAVSPVTLLCLSLSIFLFKGMGQWGAFLENYRRFVLPFSLMLPVIVWAAAEVKLRRARKAPPEAIDN